jgi:hypothetical protein
MTSEVKGWEQLFTSAAWFFPWSIGRGGARKTHRLLTLLSVAWLPPAVQPSGACLMLGTSVPVGLITPPRVPPHRGGTSADRGEHPLERVRQHSAILMLWVARHPA